MVDTFELLPVLAAGDLSQTSAPELVAAIYRSRASGTLSLEGENREEVRLFFKSGNSCGADKPAGFRSLSDVLLSQKLLNADQVERAAAEASSSGKRLGEVLLGLSLLSVEQLHGALAAQHRENLRLLLLRNVGGYEWRGWEPPPVWAGEVTVDPVRGILEALSLAQHAGRRGAVIRWLRDAQVRSSLDFADVAAKAELVMADRRAAELFASALPAESFIGSSGLQRPRAEALLVTLLLVGGVEPLPSEASQPLDASLFEPALEAQPLDVEDAPVGPADLAAQLAKELGTKAPRRPKRAARAPVPLDASELFGDSIQLANEAADPLVMAADAVKEPEEILIEATPEEEEPATDAVQDDEPLELLEGSPDDPIPGLELAAPEIPAAAAEAPPREGSGDLRRRLRSVGMRNLGVGGPIPLDDDGTSGAVPDSRADFVPAALTDEEKCFLEDVRARVKIAPKQDAYSRLGLPQSATQDQIRAAYLALVKKFHPDRAQSTPGLRQAHRDLDTLFGLLRDAYERVASKEARAEYDALGRAAPGGPRLQNRGEEAKLSLKKGAIYLKKRDFENALRELRHAVELEPTAEALAWLAWGISSDKSQGPSAREEAMKLVARALKLDTNTSRAHYVAGVLKRTTEPDDALDHFRKCVELDPRNTDAALELRLLERRRDQKRPSTGPLTKLLKRDGK